MIRDKKTAIKKMLLNIENIVRGVIQNLDMNQIVALDNP